MKKNGINFVSLFQECENVTGIFADGIFAEGIFAERNFRPKGFSPNGTFAERNFRRTEFLSSEISPNGVFAGHYDVMISKVSFRVYKAYFCCEIMFLKKNNLCLKYTRPWVTHIDHDKS